MSTITDIATESPLEAYLRLRGEGHRSCSNRSSTAGSAATRSSAAARGSSRSRRPRRCGEPVVGYLGYDHVARAGADRAAPGAARPFPRAGSSSRTSSIRFDHGEDTPPLPAPPPPVHRPSRPRPSTRSWCAARRSTSSPATSSRSSSRSGSSGRRAPPRSTCTARCASSIRRRTSSCSSSTGIALVGSSPETLVKLEADARERQSDRGHGAPGRRGRAPPLREGPRRARDAGRPRPQRPLARVRARDGRRRAVHAAGALLARQAISSPR